MHVSERHQDGHYVQEFTCYLTSVVSFVLLGPFEHFASSGMFFDSQFFTFVTPQNYHMAQVAHVFQSFMSVQ